MSTSIINMTLDTCFEIQVMVKVKMPVYLMG